MAGIQTAIRLTKEQKTKLDKLAEEAGTTPSEIIKRMIDLYEILIKSIKN